MPNGKFKQSKKATRRNKKKPKATTKKYTRRNTNNKGLVAIGAGRPTIQRGYLPFGTAYFAKLPYVENSYIEANGTTGLSSVGYTYAANNAYDPRYQTGGHQPLQYDILASHYERVWVWGCAVELTFSNPAYDGMWVGYRCRGNTNPIATTGQSLEHLQEMRESAIRPLNNTGSQKTTFKFWISNPRLLGITKAQYNNLEYSHTTGGNPAVFNLIEPFAVHTVTGETVAPVRYNIKMTYYCQFTNPMSELQN